MVSELAPVVLYLRYVVERGDVLIIEEPESHLHPEMQVEFTRFLASVVRSGVRIIMTTHSEWVLEELANLVQASQLSESERISINGSDIALNESDVGAWLFQPKKRPKGSVVEEIPLNRESGTFAAGYDKVAVDGYNRWAEMTSRTDMREGNE
jgi:energy-coupling factor transporter ATP-binding protein EcfA2